jgi:hypothetical protein
MPQPLDLTCWRGLKITHPAQWELSLATGPDEPAQCVFSDRLHQRLDVRWRPVRQPFDLDPLLDKYRPPEGAQVRKLDLPDPWRGLLRQTPEVAIVHAARFFKPVRLLAEASIVWPQKRDEATEARILADMSFVDPDLAVWPWRALGLRAQVPSEFALKSASSRVGRVTWQFSGPPRTRQTLTIERLAMPDYWLKGTLGDWLRGELPENSKFPAGARPGGKPPLTCREPSEQLLSVSPAGTLAFLGGVRLVRIDAAWRCVAEDRVYHTALTQPSRKRQLDWPRELVVHCGCPEHEE